MSPKKRQNGQFCSAWQKSPWEPLSQDWRLQQQRRNWRLLFSNSLSLTRPRPRRSLPKIFLIVRTFKMRHTKFCSIFEARKICILQKNWKVSCVQYFLSQLQKMKEENTFLILNTSEDQTKAKNTSAEWLCWKYKRFRDWWKPPSFDSPKGLLTFDLQRKNLKFASCFVECEIVEDVFDRRETAKDAKWDQKIL